QFLGHEEQKFIGKCILDKIGPPIFKLKCPVYGARGAVLLLRRSRFAPSAEQNLINDDFLKSIG
ncbi:MAG: hypothetical protein QXD61_10190, partial [Candidatus Caldarchaeum sp.]